MPTRWRSLIASRSVRFARIVDCVYEPWSAYSKNARGTRRCGQRPQIVDAGDVLEGHGFLFQRGDDESSFPARRHERTQPEFEPPAMIRPLLAAVLLIASTYRRAPARATRAQTVHPHARGGSCTRRRPCAPRTAIPRDWRLFLPRCRRAAICTITSRVPSMRRATSTMPSPTAIASMQRTRSSHRRAIRAKDDFRPRGRHGLSVPQSRHRRALGAQLLARVGRSEPARRFLPDVFALRSRDQRSLAEELAEVIHRAALQHAIYLETMLSPDRSKRFRSARRRAGIPTSTRCARSSMQPACRRSWRKAAAISTTPRPANDKLLGCGTPRPGYGLRPHACATFSRSCARCRKSKCSRKFKRRSNSRPPIRASSPSIR